MTSPDPTTSPERLHRPSAPAMRPSSDERTGANSADSARSALQWALHCALVREPADDAPPHEEAFPRPTPAQWRELETAEVRTVMDELLLQRGAEHGLDALEQLGFLDAWLPEVASMVGFGDGEWRHKDVWKHTKQVVRQSVPRLAVRWGALLHDIGKPRTRKIEGNGRVTFHGHAEVGARMFRRKTAARLGFSADGTDGALGERIHFLILHHLRPSQYDEDWTDSAVRRFYTQMGDGLGDLLDLSRADITTKRAEKRRRGVHNIAALRKRVDALATTDDKVKPLPKGLGQHVIKRFGVPPSKRLGDLMKALEATVESGELEAQKDFELYLDHLEQHRDRYGL